jgi:hypothetical protein
MTRRRSGLRNKAMSRIAREVQAYADRLRSRDVEQEIREYALKCRMAADIEIIRDGDRVFGAKWVDGNGRNRRFDARRFASESKYMVDRWTWDVPKQVRDAVMKALGEKENETREV